MLKKNGKKAHNTDSKRAYKASPTFVFTAVFFFLSSSPGKVLFVSQFRVLLVFATCTRRPVCVFWSNVGIACACKYIVCIYVYKAFLQRERVARAFDDASNDAL